MPGYTPDELVQMLWPHFTPRGGAGVALIAETVLTASAASVTFSNIPQTFQHLELWTLLRSDVNAEAEGSVIRFNADAGNNYQRRQALFRTAYVADATRNIAQLFGPRAEGNTGTANRFAGGRAWIPFYASAYFKTLLAIALVAGNISADDDLTLMFGGGHWDSTSAITSMAIFPQAGANWLAGCRFGLYGVM